MMLHPTFEILKTDYERIYLDRNLDDYLDWRVAPPGNIAEVVDIAVNTERGVGIGSRMMRLLEERALGFEIFTIYAFTRYSNDAAHRFYERLGYSPVSVIPMFYVEEDAILYVRRLK